MVAIDAKRVSGPGEPARWEIFTHGGRDPTGIERRRPFARLVAEKGAGELLVTSMDKDGTRSGYDLALTRAISDAVTVPVHRLGRGRRPRRPRGRVAQGGASAVLAASIFHFGQASVAEAKAHMAAAGLAMRLDGPASSARAPL